MPSPNVFANDQNVLILPDLNALNSSIQAIRNILYNHEARLGNLDGGGGSTGDVDPTIPGEATPIEDPGNDLEQKLQDLLDELALIGRGVISTRDLLASTIFDQVEEIMAQVNSVVERTQNITLDDIEYARQLAQLAANQANDARQAALELLASNEAVRDEVLVAQTAAETAAAEAATSASQSSTAVTTVEAAAAQAIIAQTAAAQSALDASQSADAASTSESQALTYSTQAQTYALAAETSSQEASAVRDMFELEAGALVNPGFEHERTLNGVVNVFPEGWVKSDFNLAAEWHKLGHMAPSGTSGEVLQYGSLSMFGFVSLSVPEWGIAKSLRVVDLTTITFNMQVWVDTMTIPASITRNSSTQSFIANDDAFFRITCYDSAGVVLTQTSRERWSDSLSQYQHDTNGLTGVVSNAYLTLEWTFTLPSGTDEVLIELIAVDNNNAVGVFGATTGNPRVRFDNFNVVSSGLFYDITGGGQFARQQARAAVTARNQSEAFATDAFNWASASENSSVTAQTARDESNTAAGAAATSATNAQSYANDALAYSQVSQTSQLIATAQSDFANYTDVAPDGAFAFDSGTMGWTSYINATLTNPNNKALRVTPSGTGAVIRSPVINFSGTQYNKVRAKAKIISGSMSNLSTVWLSYTTATRSSPGGHEMEPLFAGDLSPAASDGSITLMWDITQTDEAAEWASGQIQQLFLHVSPSASVIWEVDYLYVLGEAADANYRHAQASITSAANAEASESLAQSYAAAAETHALDAQSSMSAAQISETNAATAATTAAGSASTATTQAGIATTAANNAGTSATNAGISATQAANSVVDAQGAASTATTQAGIATAAATNAVSQAVALFPPDFTVNKDSWTDASTGDPTAVATTTKSIVDDGTLGKCLQMSGIAATVYSKGVLAVATGRVYRIEVIGRATTNPGDGQGRITLGLVGLDATYGTAVNASNTVATNITVVGGQFSHSAKFSDVADVGNNITAWASGKQWLRPFVQTNASETGSPVIVIKSIKITDITSEQASAISAASASISASQAAVSATDAGTAYSGAVTQKNLATEAATASLGAAASLFPDNFGSGKSHILLENTVTGDPLTAASTSFAIENDATIGQSLRMSGIGQFVAQKGILSATAGRIYEIEIVGIAVTNPTDGTGRVQIGLASISSTYTYPATNVVWTTAVNKTVADGKFTIAARFSDQADATHSISAWNSVNGPYLRALVMTNSGEAGTPVMRISQFRVRDITAQIESTKQKLLAAASAANAAISETNAASSSTTATTAASTASTQASLATGAATTAVDASNTATTQAANAAISATNAATSATNASNSASTASTQAGIATSASTSAGTAATNAAASLASAIASQVSLFPDTVASNSKEQFTNDYTGAPSGMSTASNAIVVDGTLGTSLSLTGVGSSSSLPNAIAHKGAVPLTAGKVYEIQVIFRATTNPTDGTGSWNLIFGSMDAAYGAAVYVGSNGTMTVAGGVQTVTLRVSDTANATYNIIAWTAAKVWGRPIFRANQSETGSPVAVVQSFSIKDITSQIEAAKQAAIATTQAGNAASSAAAASISETNAASSATTATNAASTATTQQTLATTAATTATTQATNAATSATNAANALSSSIAAQISLFPDNVMSGSKDQFSNYLDGSPASLAITTNNIVTNGTLGPCLELTGTTTGIPAANLIMHRGVVPLTAGKVYELEVTLIPTVDPTDGVGNHWLGFSGFDGAYANRVSATGLTTTMTVAGGVITTIARFSDVADTLYGITAWAAGKVWGRPYIRVNQSETGSPVVHLQKFSIKDVTSQIEAARQRDLAFVDQLAASLQEIPATLIWKFDSTVEGWGANSGTLTAPGNFIKFITSSTNSNITKTGLSFSGTNYDKIIIKLRINAGTPARLDTGWQLFYTTGGHEISSSYYALPVRYQSYRPVQGEWFTLVYDMSILTAGGTDWITNTITGLRFDPGSISGLEVDIDFIAVGRLNPAGSSESAAAASISASQAATSATTADTAASTATTQQTLATAAATSANNYATNAANSLASAISTQISLFPDTVVNGSKEHFSNSYIGDPTTRPTTTYSIVTNPTLGASLEMPGVTQDLAPKGVVPLTAGKVYEIEAVFIATANPTDGTGTWHLYWASLDSSYATPVTVSTSGTMTVAGGTQSVTLRVSNTADAAYSIIAWTAGKVWGRPLFRANQSEAGSPIVHIQRLSIKDITSQIEAARQAAIATTQAGNAASSAAAASISETNAASSATTANTAASTATTQQTLATSAATTATTQAGNASTSAANAAASLAAAIASQVSLFPDTVANGSKEHFSNSYGSSPGAVTTASNSIITDATLGLSLAITGVGGSGSTTPNNIATKGVVPLTAGKVYEIEAVFIATANPTDGTGNWTIFFGCFSSDYSASTYPSISGTMTVAGGVQTITARWSSAADATYSINAWTAGRVWGRPLIRFNANETGSPTVSLQKFSIKDITSQIEAARQAAIATTQAGNASTSAAAASVSASNAATSATTASGASSTATTQANLATSAATTATTQAGNAATSATAADLARSLADVNQQISSILDIPPTQFWDFTSSVEGWVATNGTGSNVSGTYQLVTTTTDPSIGKVVSINGALYDKVIARVRTTGTTPTSLDTNWELYYKTAGHGITSGYRARPVNASSYTIAQNTWFTLVFDMANLFAGGNDWITNTITELRLDLGGLSGVTYQVDFIGVGRVNPAAPAQQAASASTSAANAAISETNAATSATTASGAASTATTQAGLATTASTNATTAKTAAELARDIADVNSEISAVLDIPTTLFWDFTSTVEGWVGRNASIVLSNVSNTLNLAIADNTGSYFYISGLSFSGALYNKIVMRIRTLSTVPTTLDPIRWRMLYSVDGGHGHSYSFYGQPIKMSSYTIGQNTWFTLLWDMESLTVGGTDWVSNTITGLRIEPDANVAPVTYQIDFIAVGRANPAAATQQAAAAAISASQAATSQTNAASSAATATTQASISTSAATTATTQAGNASTSATNAAASLAAAIASQISLFPDTVAGGSKEQFTNYHTGDPTTRPTITNSIVVDGTLGSSVQLTGIGTSTGLPNSLAHKGTIPLIAGKVYEMQVVFRATTNPTDGTGSWDMYLLCLDSAYGTLSSVAITGTMTVAGGTQTATFRVSDTANAAYSIAAWTSGKVWGRPLFAVNRSEAGSPVVVVQSFSVKDITSQINAATSAAAASATAVTLFPSTFDDLSVWTDGADGIPSSMPTTTKATINDPTIGNAIRCIGTGTGMRLYTKGVLPAVAGKIYEMEVTGIAAVNPTDGTGAFSPYFRSLNASYVYIANHSNVIVSKTVADGKFTFTLRISDTADATYGIIAWNASAVWIRPFIISNESEAGSPEVRYSSFRVRDITEQINAARQAAIATTQATNASTSAANAAISASNAASSATTASGAASTATTQAGIATSASTTATTQATNAGTSATNAANSLANALATVVSLFPDNVSSGNKDQFTDASSGAGAPSVVATTSNAVVDNATLGKCLALTGVGTGTNNSVFHKGVVPLTPGKVYEFELTYIATVNPTDGVGSGIFYLFGLDGAYTTATWVGVSLPTFTVAAGVQTVTVRYSDTANATYNITAWPAGKVWGRPYVRFNQSEAGSPVVHLQKFAVKDITSQIEAAKQAAIATTQATSASTSAANAAISETNAAGSATTASGASSTATTQAGIATSAATTATTQAGTATTQAGNASTSATNASKAQRLAQVAHIAASAIDFAAFWTFDSSVGFFVVNGTFTLNGNGTARLTQVGASTAYIAVGSLSVDGSKYRYIIVRYRANQATTLSAASVTPRLYYTTSGHGSSESYRNVPMNIDDYNPYTVGDWITVVYDMHNLQAGGTDWQTNTILGFRFQPITGDDGATHDFDFIGVAAYNPAAPAQQATAASTSAANAAISETNAANSATTASGASSTATTQAGIATSAATTATTQAGTATTQAGNAATSATNAANSLAAAISSQISLFPEGVMGGSKEHFSNSYIGDPTTRPTTTYSIVTNPTLGASLEMPGVTQDLAPKGAVPLTAGRVYEVQATFIATANPTDGTGTWHLYWASLDSSYATPITVSTSGTMTVAGGVQTITARWSSAADATYSINAWTAGKVWGRPLFRANQSEAGSPIVHIQRLSIKDITSQIEAAKQAAIATTQASNASTSAANASTSASNAAGSATTATGAASTATTQAGIATSASTTATTQATNAATSATNAANSLTAAIATQVSLFTETFYPSKESFGDSWSYVGTDQPTTSKSVVDNATLGKCLAIPGVSSGTLTDVATKGYVPLTAGRVYEIEITFIATVNPTDGTGNVYIYMISLDAAFGSGSYPVIAYTFTVAAGVQTIKCRWSDTADATYSINAWGAGKVWGRPLIRFNTGEAGSPVVHLQKFSIKDITSQIEAAKQAAIATTQAASATTSAANAAISESNAAGSATTASGASSTATTQAGIATSAATTATTQAGNASTSATNAANALAAANAAAIAIFPDVLASSKNAWTDTATGNPTSLANTSKVTVTNATLGDCVQFTGVDQRLYAKGVLDPVPGRVYEIEVRGIATTNPTDGTGKIQPSMLGLDSAYAAVGSSAIATGITMTVAGGVFTATQRFSNSANAPYGVIAWPAGSLAWLRPWLRVNDGEAGTPVVAISSIKVKDVTAVVAAEIQAAAASSSATAASTSASNASTSASNAASSATTASGASSTATTQAGIATSAATTATTQAGNASTSATAAELARSLADVNQQISSILDIPPTQFWDFTSSVEGWVATNGTGSNVSGTFQIVTSTTDPYMARTGLTIDGSLYDKVVVRVRTTGTTPTSLDIAWEIYYATGGHSYSSSYRAKPVNYASYTVSQNTWFTLVFDMANLFAGGTDWVTNTITGLRLDLGGASGITYQVDFIGVGRANPGAVAQQANAAAGSAAAASVSATNAATSESNAAGSAAAASTSATVAATIGTGADLLGNPLFEKWTTTYPNMWPNASLGSGSTITKTTGGVNRYGGTNVITSVCTTETHYLYTDNLTDAFYFSQYYVLDVEVELTAGAISGAGIILEVNNSTTGRTNLSFASHGTKVGNFYRIRRVIDKSAYTEATFSYVKFWMMTNWSTLGTQTAKTLRWHKYSIRPATTEEIRTYNVATEISAAVSVETSARVSSISGIEAKYSVKVDVNGYVSGFGLISTANNDTPYSTFTLSANAFKIVDPANGVSTPQQIFAVESINGQSKLTIPGTMVSDKVQSYNGLTTFDLANGRIVMADDAWYTSFTGTVSSDATGWSGRTVRQLIPVANITNANGNTQKVRVTLTASTAASMTIGAIYIGHGAGAGDVYDFAAAPTQLFFTGGVGNKVVAANTTEVVEGTFAYNGTSPLVISFYFSTTSSIRHVAVSTGNRAFYKAANDPTTVDATGYTETSNLICVTKVETYW